MLADPLLLWCCSSAGKIWPPLFGGIGGGVEVEGGFRGLFKICWTVRSGLGGGEEVDEAIESLCNVGTGFSAGLDLLLAVVLSNVFVLLLIGL
jgi:hypothetical protein